MSSHFLLAAAQKTGHDFPVLKEARREVLEDLMDIENAKQILNWINDGKIKVEFLLEAVYTQSRAKAVLLQQWQKEDEKWVIRSEKVL